MTNLPWYLGADVPAHISAHLKDRAAAFLRDGYAIFENSISTKTCDLVLSEFEKLERANPKLFDKHRDADGHYPRFVNLHAVLPSLLKLFHENREALEFQDALFEEETVLYTSLFYERGSAQNLHRDTPYFCTRPEYRYFGMWVALEDVDETNGPLMVAPGGHRLEELDREAIALAMFPDLTSVPAQSEALWDAYQSKVAAQAEAAGIKVIPLPVKKGTTIIWHPQLPHGGSQIQDLKRTRFSLVMHTTPNGVPVYHQNVFFNPAKPFPTKATWHTAPSSGRRYVQHYQMSFGHEDPHRASDFKGLGNITPLGTGDRLAAFLEKVQRKVAKTLARV